MVDAGHLFAILIGAAVPPIIAIACGLIWLLKLRSGAAQHSETGTCTCDACSGGKLPIQRHMPYHIFRTNQGDEPVLLSTRAGKSLWLIKPADVNWRDTPNINPAPTYKKPAPPEPPPGPPRRKAC